jgi:hypothetical protein
MEWEKLISCNRKKRENYEEIMHQKELYEISGNTEGEGSEKLSSD